MKKTATTIAFSMKVLFITLLALLCLWFVISQAVLPTERNPRDYYVTDFNEGWTHVSNSGEPVPFEIPGTCDVEPGTPAVFKKTLPAEIDSNMWLCFRTSKQEMYIYIDGQLRESFSTEKTRPFGVASASVYLLLELHEEDAGKIITINVTSDSSYSGVMRGILYGDKTGIFYQIFMDNVPTVILACAMLFLGIASIVISYILQVKFKTKIPLTYLGWSMVTVSLWIITQSKMRQVFFSNVSVTSAFSHFVLLLTPIPFSIYMNGIQNGRYRKYYMCLSLATFLNFFINIILIMSSIVDQTDLGLPAYVLFGILIVMVFTTIGIDIKKKHIQSYIIVAYGILGFLISAILQIFQSLNKTILFNGNVLTIGFIFMLLMAGAQTFKDTMKSENEKKQALYASEAKAKFLASMSHEIRTPINAVLGLNEMIAAESTESTVLEYTQDIQTAGRSLLAIVNDILDFSKIESGKMQIVPMEYDLSSVINDSCNMVRLRAEKKGLSFRIYCDEKLPSRLLGDEVRIRQVLINLLTNAIKYTNEGSVSLSVNGRTDDEGIFTLELSVEDTGIGIKEDAIPVLFDSFSRVDEEITHKIEGTGLGLSIVHNLIELMNGKIIVESQYGKGSIFTVFLPQKVISRIPIGNLANADSHHTTPVNNEPFLAPGARLLVVDDVPMNLKVFAGLLKDTMVHVDTAASGRECLAKLQTNKYDIIFLDHMMPDLDGIQTLKVLQNAENDKVKNTPVIMLTANAILGAKEEYLKKGFRDYLSKPIQKEKLLRMVKQYLPQELIVNKLPEAPDEPKSMLERFDFLDTESGLSFFGGDEEFYVEIIQAFVESGYYEEIQGYYKNEDWSNYQIRIHAMASSAKSIGAEDLCLMARKLENAAAERSDIPYILAHHEETMTLLQTLTESINEALSAAPTSGELVSTLENVNIVVVDDDAIILKTANKILKNYFHVICLKNGKDALTYSASHDVDLILLDIHMPEMDGFEVLKQLKEKPETQNIPVIFLTADTDYETELNCFKAGAMDYIRKPFIPDIALERINRVIKLKHT